MSSIVLALGDYIARLIMAGKKKEDAPVVRGYKVFDKDWMCRGFQYEVGKTFRLEEGKTLVPCARGFHFCKKAAGCFNYHDFSPENKCAEVEAVGEVIEDGDKCVTDAIRIVREIGWHEMLELCNAGRDNTGHHNSGNWNSGYWNSGNWNSGNWNSGNCNSGYCNSGNWNSGNCNSGDCNSGYRNSGNWNTGHHNSGYLNSGRPKVRIFNHETDVKLNDLVFPNFFFDVRCCQWVREDCMTEQEKAEHEEYKTTGGYVRKVEYRQAWREAFNAAKGRADWESERQKLLALPNFDFGIFEEITGITELDIMSAPCGAEEGQIANEIKNED